MSGEMWLAILVCALGTFALRLVPLIWMQHHMAQKNEGEEHSMPRWLSVLGPLMVAAMLGTSMMPIREDWIGACSTFIGTLVTWWCWLRYRTLGRPVFFGVVAFGMTTFLLSVL